MNTVRPILPNKLYFKIGEVSTLIGVKPHVLRYWEAEFPRYIRPEKSKTNQRLYRRKDVENIFAIRHLLYHLKYTIDGARQYLDDEGAAAAMPPEPSQAHLDAAAEEARAALRKELANSRQKTRAQYEKKLLEIKSDLMIHIRALEKEFK
ncbi:MAG: MerR family transcriptional regulator [Myxococcales bacterium]|jgi:DNA-binding transcriptional MerR regulator|nr:MerR family transcriptional regulator [Myxococcales bacterium]